MDVKERETNLPYDESTHPHNKANGHWRIDDASFEQKYCSEPATYNPINYRPEMRRGVLGGHIFQGIESAVDSVQNILIKYAVGDRNQIEALQVSLVDDPAYDFPKEINGIPTAEALRYPATMEAFKKVMIGQGATDTLKGLEKYEELEKARDYLPSKDDPKTPADCENTSSFYVTGPKR